MVTEIPSIAISVKNAPDLQKLGKNEIVVVVVGGGLTKDFLMKITIGVFLPEVDF
jgi:peptidase E